MSNLLARIDAATEGLCPCGAEPADGSAYCSDDCRPTHIADDTDTRMAGHHATAMRWRPDLVTAAPDNGLIPRIGPHPYGPFTAEVFDRADGSAVHLRLDDGHRFVGVDLIPAEWETGSEEAWQRLARELTRTDRTMPAGRRRWGTALDSASAGDHIRVALYTGPPDDSDAGEDACGVTWAASGGSFHFPVGAFEGLAEAFRAIDQAAAAVTAMVAEANVMADDVSGDVSEDPRERALRLRRNRNTGPPVPQRAPRRIDARRSR